MKKSMLLTTIAMIVVVVIALSTATFAWFSASAQTAVDGTMTIEAGANFVFQTPNADKTTWDNAAKIDITAGIAGDGTKITPVSPTRALNDEAKGYVTHGTNVDTHPTNNNGVWYQVKGDKGTWNELGVANSGYAITSFRVLKANGAGNANINFTIKADNNANGLKAVESVRVVLQVTSYSDDGTTPVTKYYGTQYVYGGAGLVKAGATLDKDTVEADNYKGATGAGTPITKEDFQEISLGNVYSNLTQTTTFEQAAAANKGLSKFTENGEEKVARAFTQQVTFNSTYMQVTAFVWLDGHSAKDDAAGKNVSLNIGFIDPTATV